MKKNKLQKLLNVLTTTDDLAEDNFVQFEKSVKKLSEGLKRDVTVKTLDEVNSKLGSLKQEKDQSISELLESLNKLKEEVESRKLELLHTLNAKSNELTLALNSSEAKQRESIAPLFEEVSNLKKVIAELSKPKDDKTPSLLKSIAELEAKIKKLAQNQETQTQEASQNLILIKEQKQSSDISKTELKEALDNLRRDLTSKISNIGGGNANRAIFVGGNTSTLAKYTDLNLKAGTNVTISYASNDTLKTTDITFAATGGPGGTVRSINSISTDTSAGDTSGTDYVYLCSAALTLTLPTAAGNTNLYTIKNVGTGLVTIATTGGQTIDSQANIQLPIQYTSVDIISDTANWNLT